MDLNNSNLPPITNNNHYLYRNRNLRNELLRQSDYLILPDVYSGLTEEQKKEITDYRKELRDFINLHKDEYLSGVGFIKFPDAPEWTGIKLPNY